MTLAPATASTAKIIVTSGGRIESNTTTPTSNNFDSAHLHTPPLTSTTLITRYSITKKLKSLSLPLPPTLARGKTKTNTFCQLRSGSATHCSGSISSTSYRHRSFPLSAPGCKNSIKGRLKKEKESKQRGVGGDRRTARLESSISEMSVAVGCVTGNVSLNVGPSGKKGFTRILGVGSTSASSFTPIMSNRDLQEFIKDDGGSQKNRSITKDGKGLYGKRKSLKKWRKAAEHRKEARDSEITVADVEMSENFLTVFGKDLRQAESVDVIDGSSSQLPELSGRRGNGGMAEKAHNGGASSSKKVYQSQKILPVEVLEKMVNEGAATGKRPLSLERNRTPERDGEYTRNEEIPEISIQIEVVRDEIENGQKVDPSCTIPLIEIENSVNISKFPAVRNSLAISPLCSPQEIGNFDMVNKRMDENAKIPLAAIQTENCFSKIMAQKEIAEDSKISSPQISVPQIPGSQRPSRKEVAEGWHASATCIASIGNTAAIGPIQERREDTVKEAYEEFDNGEADEKKSGLRSSSNLGTIPSGRHHKSKLFTRFFCDSADNSPVQSSENLSMDNVENSAVFVESIQNRPAIHCPLLETTGGMEQPMEPTWSQQMCIKRKPVPSVIINSLDVPEIGHEKYQRDQQDSKTSAINSSPPDRISTAAQYPKESLSPELPSEVSEEEAYLENIPLGMGSIQTPPVPLPGTDAHRVNLKHRRKPLHRNSNSVEDSSGSDDSTYSSVGNADSSTSPENQSPSSSNQSHPDPSASCLLPKEPGSYKLLHYQKLLSQERQTLRDERLLWEEERQSLLSTISYAQASNSQLRHLLDQILLQLSFNHEQDLATCQKCFARLGQSVCVRKGSSMSNSSSRGCTVRGTSYKRSVDMRPENRWMNPRTPPAIPRREVSSLRSGNSRKKRKGSKNGNTGKGKESRWIKNSAFGDNDLLIPPVPQIDKTRLSVELDSMVRMIEDAKRESRGIGTKDILNSGRSSWATEDQSSSSSSRNKKKSREKVLVSCFKDADDRSKDNLYQDQGSTHSTNLIPRLNTNFDNFQVEPLKIPPKPSPIGSPNSTTLKSKTTANSPEASETVIPSNKAIGEYLERKSNGEFEIGAFDLSSLTFTNFHGHATTDNTQKSKGVTIRAELEGTSLEEAQTPSQFTKPKKAQKDVPQPHIHTPSSGLKSRSSFFSSTAIIRSDKGGNRKAEKREDTTKEMGKRNEKQKESLSSKERLGFGTGEIGGVLSKKLRLMEKMGVKRIHVKKSGANRTDELEVRDNFMDI